MFDSHLAKRCALWNHGIIETRLPYLTVPPPLLWLVVLDKCNLDQIVTSCSKNSLYWRSRYAFTNVRLVMVQIGRGKDKTNRQLVPIMVLLGADGPVITGLETCNCTQLWVLLSKFGEAETSACWSQNSSNSDVCTLLQQKLCTSLIVSIGQRSAEAAAVTFEGSLSLWVHSTLPKDHLRPQSPFSMRLKPWNCLQ